MQTLNITTGTVGDGCYNSHDIINAGTGKIQRLESNECMGGKHNEFFLWQCVHTRMHTQQDSSDTNAMTVLMYSL